jgi:uncharacterized protein YraI
MFRKYLMAAALAALAAQPAAAALIGWSTASMYMHSGPARGYPVLAHVAPGTDLEIHGCVKGMTWCDASWRTFRGWVPARFLDLTTTQPDIPTGVFEQHAYWDTNYRRYPFYAERRWWTAVPDVLPDDVQVYTFNE